MELRPGGDNGPAYLPFAASLIVTEPKCYLDKDKYNANGEYWASLRWQKKCYGEYSYYTDLKFQIFIIIGLKKRAELSMFSELCSVYNIYKYCKIITEKNFGFFVEYANG